VAVAWPLARIKHFPLGKELRYKQRLTGEVIFTILRIARWERLILSSSEYSRLWKVN